jgi:hypothetical protein
MRITAGCASIAYSLRYCRECGGGLCWRLMPTG